MEPTASYNKLTPAELERLSILSEECGEVIQAVGKVLRHGYHDNDFTGEHNNRLSLEKECGDVRQAMIMMCKSGDLRKDAIHHYANSKEKRISKYLHHQK